MNLPEHIIVYDGQCHFCNGWLRFLPPRDPHKRYHYCPMQTATGRALLRQHGLDPDDPVSFLYLERGQPRYGADAIIRIVSGLGGWWRGTVVLRAIPGVLREAAYGVVARNRYRWWPKTAACVIPSEDLRVRFLEWPSSN